MDKYKLKIRRMVSRFTGDKIKNNKKNVTTITGQKENISENKIMDNLVIESSKNIEIIAKCQVLIVGGGPSGISAAIASSREGADTIIVERYGCLGGVITTVGMETIGWYRYQGTTDCQGIGIEMEKIAAKMGGTTKWPYNESQCLDADFFKIVADKLIEENNIRSILHCFVVDVIIENKIIKGIVTESKSGRKAILADRVIDCTGDADVAYFSGAKYRKVSIEDAMGVTTVFNCAGVDKQKFIQYTEEQKTTYKEWGGSWNQSITNKEENLRTPYLHKEFQKAIDKKIIPQSSQNISGSWSTLTDAGEANNLNLVHMKGIDTTNVFDLTKAEIQGRKETLNAIKALKTFVPGFENAKLRNFGMTLGIRDSRKIIGMYNLTKEDVMGEAKFNDSIGIFPEFVDGYNILMLPTSGRYFQVPFRCLVPLEIDNLLVAGRCVAGDNISHAAMRNMMACTVTGQGAGAASAISIRENCMVRNVNIENVQNELIKQNVRIW